jgi:DNA-binding SARP family transcriptional activator
METPPEPILVFLSQAREDESLRQKLERKKVMQLEQVIQLEQDIPFSCRLRAYLHGPLEVWKREASGAWKLVGRDAWGKGRPARSVFKRLLVTSGRRLSRGAIQDDLWPNTENFELADKTVYNAINQIRRVTGKTLVRTFETIYEVADQPVVWVDRDACESLLKEAENRGYTSIQALPLLERALGYLERGELLEGESGTWVYGLRKKSEDLLRQCRLWLAESAESYEIHGKNLQAGLQYRALLQTVPPDEDALQAWIEMLHRHGKTQDALRCYQDTKSFVEAQGFTLSHAIEQWVASLDKPPLRTPGLHSPLVQRVYPLIQDILVPKPVLLGSPLVSESLSESPFLQAITNAQEYTSLISLEEFFLQCEACIKVCWHAMNHKGLALVEETLLNYTPPLLSFALQPSKYQKTAARLLTHIHFLQAVITKHRLDFAARELHCLQAVQYSRLAEDTVLEAASLMYLAYTYIYCSPLRPTQAVETFLSALSLLTQEKSLLVSDI